MKQLLFLAAAVALAACTPSDPEVARWEARARNVTIIRDDWGIPHIYGKTDADAVFGLLYAQAEDDFNRVEANYLNALGRLAEAEGEEALWRDLRMKLFIDPADLRRRYAASPDWLRALMDAFADGLNYYLHTHPDVRPRVITRFEAWMALSFSEGSIGGDIETVSLSGLKDFYLGREAASGATGTASGLPTGAGPFRGRALARADAAPQDPAWPPEPSGSNGFAIAPSNTAAGRALLLINPHTSFFFRAEVQVTSDEGLNAYGAVTWGQFFVYQGFNERAGWMHTSSGVDAIDEYAETIVEREGGLFYRYGDELRPVTADTITLPYRTDSGMVERRMPVYRTHHGPVVREAGGKWITVRLMQEPVKALTQSYLRTKATTLQAFRETMELHANSSNNTVYADADGNIAYFHANFIPRRDAGFDWSRPVDGSDPATEWQGIHRLDEAPNVINPSTGWIQNTNNWPYSAAGPDSPRPADYPAYMDRSGENPRGVHALLVLDGVKDFTLASLITAAYDPYQPAFADLIAPLVRAWDAAPAAHPLKARLAEPIALLREWDYRWSVESVPLSLAAFWDEALSREVGPAARQAELSTLRYMAERATPAQRLAALAAALDRLEADFGTWRTPWGEINRFQRLTGDIVHPFDDTRPSIPVGFASSRWGSLAAFGARRHGVTKRFYGTSGNSFVAVVEFGDSVRARAVTAGGQSGHPASPHFNDQAERYAAGDLRPVYFYRSQLTGRTEREYRPGSR
jgi:acyl-homoserine-lactone acylase